MIELSHRTIENRGIKPRHAIFYYLKINKKPYIPLIFHNTEVKKITQYKLRFPANAVYDFSNKSKYLL